MKPLVLAIMLLSCVASAAGGQGYRPGGLLPEAPAAPVQGQSGWRPGGTIGAPERNSAPAATGQTGDQGALYPLKQAVLPGKPTDVEGLLGVVDRLSPDLGFLQTYVLRLQRVRAANELERAQIAERERQRFTQLAANDTIWLAGSVKLGDYDPATSTFPVLNSEFVLRQNAVRIQFVPSEQMVFQALPMPLAEARIALARLRPDRKLSVLVEAAPRGAGRSSFVSAGEIGATLFFEPRRITFWQPSTDGDPPLVIAVLGADAIAKARVGVPPAKPAAAPESLVLNQESVALLLAQTAPERMTDAVYIQMMINRWILERRKPAFPVMADGWPAFFHPDQPAPHAAELQSFLPAFKSWVSDRLAQLPKTVAAQLATNASYVHECTAFGPAGGFDNNDGTQRSLMEGILTVEAQAELLQRHLIEQNRRRGPDEVYLAGPLYFGMPARNLGFEQSSVERYTQTHCRGERSGQGPAWDEAIAMLPAALRPSGYPIGILKIDPWARRARVVAAGSLADFRVSGTIAATQIVTAGDGRPKLVITLAPQNLSELEPDREAKQFKVHMIAAAADFTASAASRPAEAASAQPLRPVASSPPANATFDILGIRLGMSIAEAEAAIRAHARIGWTFKFAPRNAATTTVFTTGTVHISESRNDYFILVHDPRLKNNALLAIGRFNYEGPNAINEAALIEGLVTKYGVRRHSQAEGTIYQFAERASASSGGGNQPCSLQIGSLSQPLLFTDAAGRPADFSNAMHPNLRGILRDVSGLPWVGFQNLYLNDLSKLRGCRPNVTAWIPANSGSVAGFLLWLSDLDNYAAELTKLLSGAAPGAEQTRRAPRL